MSNPVLDALKPEAQALLDTAKADEPNFVAYLKSKSDALVTAFITLVVGHLKLNGILAMFAGAVAAALQSAATPLANALAGSEQAIADAVLADGQKAVDAM